jgi:hypothetical protein
MARGVAIDPNTRSSIVDGDATGLVEGCPSLVGGAFCRVDEATDAKSASLWFVGPPAACDRSACVFVKVYNQQGQLVWGGEIPKGKTRVEAKWSSLLARDTFEIGDRGFWSFSTTVYWIGPDGKERESVSLGDILLRVFRTGYVPLDRVESDPAFVWTWQEGGMLYRMTSGLRAFVRKL